MIIRCGNHDNRPLAELARHTAVQHPPRSPERRAAAHLHVTLTTTRSPTSARRVLTTFGTPQAQADAASLLWGLQLKLCGMLCGTAPGSCTEAGQ